MTSRCFLLSLLLLAIPGLAGPDAWGPFEWREYSVAPGDKLKTSFVSHDNFAASYLNAPIWIARGGQTGPTLCVSAGIHGDEINSVAIAQQVFAEVDADALQGTLIVLPAININGFRHGSRYLPDRRDLNRFFPGTGGGSVASIIARAVFTDVIQRCDALVDLHTASNKRDNLPQIRADAEHKASLELARHFGTGIIVGGKGPEGSLRRATVDAGIPAIIYEAGEPLRFQVTEIAEGVEGVRNVMEYLDMISGQHQQVRDSRLFLRTTWQRVPLGLGGFFFPSVKLGQVVVKGEPLGEIVDPLSDRRHALRANHQGEIIGMAIPQVVLSGYALYHIGVAADASSSR